MAAREAELLQQFGEALMADFIKILPSVTGDTAAAIRMEVDEEGNILTIFGPEHIATLESGRGPTVSGGPGDVLKGIREWIARKGLNLSPFAVAVNIHKHGNTLFRQLKGSGPVNKQANPIGLEQVLTEQRLKSFNTLVGKEFAPRIESDILPNFKLE